MNPSKTPSLIDLQDRSKEMAKPGMTNAEREAMAQEMDADLEAFIEEKMKTPRVPEPPDNRSVDEIAEELLQHPAFMQEFDPSKPMSPAMEALQQLKYDCEDAYDKADSYKDDGNHNFKIKKYHWAITSYTEGIKALTKDKEINAILYSNRSAANFHLGNYGTSYKDSVIALKFKPDHMKAVNRAVMCSLQLRKYDQAIHWCDYGLKINPQDEKLQESRTKAEKSKRDKERDHRKQEAQRRKALQKERKLLQVIQSRGVQLAGVKPGNLEKAAGNDVLTSLEAPGVECPKVQIDENGCLTWPVLFVYPEYKETDFIKMFHEDSTFADHLETMFSPGCAPAPWDTEHKYKVQDLELYFENRVKKTIHSVKPSTSLRQLLQDKRYIVHGGTPGVIVMVKNSPFAKEFKSRY